MLVGSGDWMGSFILEPVFIHGFEKLGRKWESCLRNDDGVDATSGTQRGLTNLGLVFVYPLFDHGRGKRAATIEASAQIALFNLLSMTAGKAVGNVQIDEGFRIHSIPPIVEVRRWPVSRPDDTQLKVQISSYAPNHSGDGQLPAPPWVGHPQLSSLEERRRIILLARISLTSRCRGIGSDLPFFGLWSMLCLPPWRSKIQPDSSN